MKIVIVTGGFDPIHSGHIEYFKEARKLGDVLFVGLNSDEWLTRKKGRPFMSFKERLAVVGSLRYVDDVVQFNDDDGTARDSIVRTRNNYPDAEIIFANGGDRTKDNIPEMDIVDPKLSFAFGVGGEDKKNSSSWILKEWNQPTTERSWGRYTILNKGPGWQVKKLEFDENKSLSDQRHFIRSEHWHIVDGKIKIEIEHPDGTKRVWFGEEGDSFDIPALTWHKATNVGGVTARVVEVWMGSVLSEDDIERRD